MSDPTIRLGCLELATQLLKPQGNYSADDVVKTAMTLYTFTQASTEVATPPSTVDKPSKSSKAKQPDIMS